MTQTILRDRTGGTGYWTKGFLSCVERCCEGSDGPRRASSLHFWPALPPQNEEQARRDCLQLHSHFSAPWKLLSPDHDMATETQAA